jgi:hypothetical protein
MNKVLYILRQLVVLLLAVAWFQMTAHIDICHCDEAASCLSDTMTVCSCHCHVACINHSVEASLPVEHHATIKISSADEMNRGQLVPNDIFRPPLQIKI